MLPGCFCLETHTIAVLLPCWVEVFLTLRTQRFWVKHYCRSEQGKKRWAIWIRKLGYLRWPQIRAHVPMCVWMCALMCAYTCVCIHTGVHCVPASVYVRVSACRSAYICADICLCVSWQPTQHWTVFIPQMLFCPCNVTGVEELPIIDPSQIHTCPRFPLPPSSEKLECKYLIWTWHLNIQSHPRTSG